MDQGAHPQTNGVVERFNGRISSLVRQTRLASAADLAAPLNPRMTAYNHQIPLLATPAG